MAKIDWLKHCKAFLKKHDDTVAERKAYCEKKRLNYNSFRPQLAKYKKSQAYKNSIAQQTPARQAKKGAAQSDKSQSAQKGESGGRRVRDLSNENDSVKPNSERLANGTYRFTEGNTASVLHGRYAKKAFLSQEYQELSQGGYDDRLALFKQQFHLVNNESIRRLQEITELYENGDAIKRTTFTAEGKVVETPLTQAEATNEVLNTSAAALSEMMKVVNVAEKTLVDRYVKYSQLNEVTQSQKDRILADLMRQKSEEKWSVFEFIEECTKQYVDVPVWAIKQLEHELRTAEPEIDLTGGITAEAARVLREESMKRRAGRKERLEAIKQRNATIYASSQELGKEKETIAEEEEVSGG